MLCLQPTIAKCEMYKEVLLRRNGSKSCGDVLMKDIKDRKLRANFAYSLYSYQLTNCNLYNIKTN